jgi:uncharacterized protein (DUF983 family)
MPVHHTSIPTSAGRSPLQALWSGFRGRCPACTTGSLFRAYLKVSDSCPDCRTELHHQRADDAPAYFVMVIVGHLVVPLVLMVEVAFQPSLWLHAAIWLPLVLLLSLALLPRVKGAIIGLQWAFGMHGFGAPGSVGPLALYGTPSDRPAPGP